MVVLVLAAAALFVVWLIDLYFKPYTSCGRCKGTAKRGGASRYGRCPRCKGEPERMSR